MDSKENQQTEVEWQIENVKSNGSTKRPELLLMTRPIAYLKIPSENDHTSPAIQWVSGGRNKFEDMKMLDVYHQ